MNKNTAFLLGQIYGKITGLNHVWKNYDDLAMVNPMKAIAMVNFLAMDERLIDDSVMDYLTLRFKDMDAEDAMETIDNLELAKTFMIGKASVSTPLPEVIKKIGIPQEAIAKKIGVSKNTVSRWATGESTPSQKVRYELEKLCQNPYGFEYYDGLILIDEVWYSKKFNKYVIEDRGLFYGYQKPYVAHPSFDQFKRIKIGVEKAARKAVLHPYDMWGRGLLCRRDLELYKQQGEKHETNEADTADAFSGDRRDKE